jgi:eukaryotic-like serine/threonine-protein kinase
MREVRAAARLMHPNIVTAYDANQIGDRHYMVMEFVDGPNLENLVRDRGPLAVGQACDFVRQAALGLQAAHEMGMVHRDIKPANLLVQGVGPDGKPTRCIVKILDFGLASMQEPKPGQAPGSGSGESQQNVVVGTPDYLSPEQAKNLRDADIRSDLYSLGCTFYYLLTGNIPFPGGNTLEKLFRHAMEDPVPIETVRPDLPAEVIAIIRRLMAKKPEDRYPTPAALAEALAPLAISGPPTWTSEEPAEVSEPVSPSPDAEPDNALIGTLPTSQAPTPLSGDTVPRRSRRQLHYTLLIISIFLSFFVAAAILIGIVVAIRWWPF